MLSAVGIKTNIENIGLEVGIATDKDKILVNALQCNKYSGYYAVRTSLAHAEESTVEKIAGCM
jgi:dihydrolipoamide dehydrogenase